MKQGTHQKIAGIQYQDRVAPFLFDIFYKRGDAGPASQRLVVAPDVGCEVQICRCAQQVRVQIVGVNNCQGRRAGLNRDGREQQKRAYENRYFS
jgi:hypothetical protein